MHFLQLNFLAKEIVCGGLEPKTKTLSRQMSVFFLNITNLFSTLFTKFSFYYCFPRESNRIQLEFTLVLNKKKALFFQHINTIVSGMSDIVLTNLKSNFVKSNKKITF